MTKLDRNERRAVVHRRVRRKVQGTASRPRLAVFRSSKHIYVQAVDDDRGVTLAQAATVEKELRGRLKSGSDVAAARTVGELIATRLTAAGVTAAVFDRGGWVYHGRIKAVAEGARAGGLQV